MKKQNENGRIPEDRLSRANKRKKNNTIASILVMTGCLLVLVLVTYVAGILYSWIDSKFQNNANDLAAAAEAGSQTELMAGGGVALIGTTLVPLLSGLFG